MTFPEIVESKDLLWGRTCAVDNVRARRKGVLGKLYEILKFHTWKGSSQFPEISQRFWHGVCSALPQPLALALEALRPPGSGEKLGIFIPHRNYRGEIHQQWEYDGPYITNIIWDIDLAELYQFTKLKIVVIMWPFGDYFPYYSHHENYYSSANSRVMG